MGQSSSRFFASASDDLLLRPGTRLLHIGPFKTATSALQGAFAQARQALAGRGVVYPAGALRHWLRPTIALTGALSIRGHPEAEPWHWDQLVEAFEQAGDSTVVHSSEFFSDCEPEQIERAVRDLGGPHPVHVVVTVRPLLKILPSQWQMHIRDGWIHTPYDAWLRQILADAPIEPGDPSARFWHRHDHARLAERWAAAVGPQNVSVIVIDPVDRSAILRSFEAMLGLPRGFLEFEPGHLNESLPYGRTELLRLVNREFDRRDWGDADYGRLIRHGATARMRVEHAPLSAEHPAYTLPWARKRAIEIGARIAQDLAGLGVRVVGEPDNLRIGTGPDDDGSLHGSSPTATTGTESSEAWLASEAAAQFAIGILENQQKRVVRLRKALAQSRKHNQRVEQRLTEEQQSRIRLATELATTKKALDPAQPEKRRTIELDSLTLLRIIARRITRRLRRRLRSRRTR